ncbi:phage/plasmid primase, P4 family [Marinobacter changyiensis]|uniref:phage/plasmid primase, P4 family n=1 Tax=Marinobacter changyiensis TaxID=2604091 RepID=UPI0012654AE9|nr:phage/plasmid primase, P4 family [Marinobacter changyiensis]
MATAPMSKVYTDTPPNVVTPTLDLEAAKQFLNAFGGRHTFQTFDDTDQNRRDLARIFHGGAEHLPQLAELNAKGAGIFFTVNQTDQKGRKAENVTAVRAVFLDLDGAPLEPVIDAARVAGLEPHMVIETSPGKYHVYWLVEGVKPEYFTAAQRALAIKFGGDPKVCDLPRVMRVPGFLHHKDQPFRSVQIAALSGPAYLLPALIRGLDLRVGSASPASAPRSSQGGIGDDEDIVTEGGRNDTLASRGGQMRRFGMGLEAITAALLAENKIRCSPPLSEREVRTIAASIGKYRPDKRASVPMLRYAEIEQKINDTEDVDTLTGRLSDLITVSTMRGAQKQVLYKIIARKAGTTVPALMADAKAMAETEDNHMSTAGAAIAAIGESNLLHAQSTFWKWSGKVWEPVHDRQVKKTIHAVAGRTELTGHVVGSVLDLIKTEVYRPTVEFDRLSGVINCLNGELTYSGDEWHLAEHRRDRYLTTLIPVEYDPEAQAPRFNKFLCEVFQGDADAFEKITVVGEALGYSLIPSSHLERFFMLIGSGANGKSVLLGVLKDLLGAHNVAAVKPSQFENQFQRAHLRGKLANIITEIEEGGQIADAQLKALVSGETTTAEQKHRDPFDFVPFATQWFGTNHFPHTRDFSQALFRRALVLTFNREFCEADRDVGLAARLREELPGILNFALAGLARLYRFEAFTMPESSREAARAWRMEADQISQFVEETCDTGPDMESETGVIYQAYRSWATSAGIQRKVSHKSFTTRLEARGLKRSRRTGGKRFIHGLSLRRDDFDFQQSTEEGN